MLDCNPVIIIGLEEPVAVNDPGDEVTVYDVALPPVVAGVNDMDALPLLNALPDAELVAVTEVGTPGVVFGIHHTPS